MCSWLPACANDKSSGLLRVTRHYMTRTRLYLYFHQMKHTQSRAGQERQQVGLARILRAHFKKWNYPCSLVVLSKHSFFFTAPHKGPFDIFLMESAKPTFGSNTPPPLLFLQHTTLSRNTQVGFKQTNSPTKAAPSLMNPTNRKKKKNLRKESSQRKENEHEFNESTLVSGPLWLVQESSADLWKKCAPSSPW